MAVEEVSLKWFSAVGTVSRLLYDGQIQRWSEERLTIFKTGVASVR